ncbi:uncharacterized protein LOC110700373 isoform X2 [Chenopodium quinoa]|uniref:uncharacterized protein LOC110700373 isoform X2 n=1 Tax=Chenopodium quinoa TaxID=63459 RepID=UPI000B794964|nr:uncharacterized protein LOC110700373 isoform X2 [Chenopodium quinoa]
MNYQKQGLLLLVMVLIGFAAVFWFQMVVAVLISEVRSNCFCLLQLEFWVAAVFQVLWHWLHCCCFCSCCSGRLLLFLQLPFWQTVAVSAVADSGAVAAVLVCCCCFWFAAVSGQQV